MASVKQYLSKILSARFGKDVREAIHDSIYAMNEQLENAEAFISDKSDIAATSASIAVASETNAKESENLAKEYKDKAFTYTPEGYEELVDEVWSSGIKTSTKSPLLNTKPGGLRFNSIGGKSEQNVEPTPANPVPILNAFDCVEMVQGFYSVSDGLYRSDASRICSKNFISCKEGDVIKVTTDINRSYYITQYSDSGYVSSQSATNVGTAIFTIPNGITKFALRIENVNAADNLTPSTVGKIAFRINNKYVALVKTSDGNGKEAVATILLDAPLCGIGDAKDEIVNKNGVWGVVRRFETVILDGSEYWNSNGTSTSGVYRFYTTDLQIKAPSTSGDVANVLCNRHPRISATDTWNKMNGISVSPSGPLYIYYDWINYDDVSVWKEELEERPLTVTYEMATPTFEELPLEDQIALNSFETFNGATTILFDSYVKPSFEVAYGTSENGAKTLLALKNIYELDKTAVKKGAIVNNLATTNEGFVLDARQGKVLNDKMTALQGSVIVSESKDYVSNDDISVYATKQGHLVVLSFYNASPDTVSDFLKYKAAVLKSFTRIQGNCFFHPAGQNGDLRCCVMDYTGELTEFESDEYGSFVYYENSTKKYINCDNAYYAVYGTITYLADNAEPLTYIKKEN